MTGPTPRSRSRSRPPPGLPSCFVAIDFETADRGPDSACSLALARVESGSIVATQVRLVRPPRRQFEFTHIHGITWQDVADQPAFGEVWSGLSPMLDGAECLVAHNAPFDRRVLEACCWAAGIRPPPLPFQCTVRMARSVLGIRPANLANVCLCLGIPLDHHDALSDATACARIAIAAAQAAS